MNFNIAYTIKHLNLLHTTHRFVVNNKNIIYSFVRRHIFIVAARRWEGVLELGGRHLPQNIFVYLSSFPPPLQLSNNIIVEKDNTIYCKVYRVVKSMQKYGLLKLIENVFPHKKNSMTHIQ